MQLLCRWHGRAELQQLQRHGVFQVDLRWLAAAKAAQEAQALPRPFPGWHGGCGGKAGSGGTQPGWQRKGPQGRGKGSGGGGGQGCYLGGMI